MSNHTHNPGEVFVFGSNLAGIHGAGAAQTAYKLHGAKYGHGVGRVGMSYAIPTKGIRVEPIHLERIIPHIEVFLDYAYAHKDTKFFVTALGTGLAGFSHADIGVLFRGHTPNCRMPPEWMEYL